MLDEHSLQVLQGNKKYIYEVISCVTNEAARKVFMLLRLTESTRNPRITPKAIREYFCFLNKLHSAE